MTTTPAVLFSSTAAYVKYERFESWEDAYAAARKRNWPLLCYVPPEFGLAHPSGEYQHHGSAPDQYGATSPTRA